MAEYALPEDAFRGLSPADKASWAVLGAAFNSTVFGPVEDSFAHNVQRVAEAEQEADPERQGYCLVTFERAYIRS